MYTSYNIKIWVYGTDLIQPHPKMLVRREGKFRPMLPFIQRDRFWFLRVFLGTKYQQPAVSHLQEPALLRRTVAKLHEFERTDLQVEASNSVSLQSFDCFVIYSPRYQASPFKLSFTNGISASQSNQILVFFLNCIGVWVNMKRRDTRHFWHPQIQKCQRFSWMFYLIGECGELESLGLFEVLHLFLCTVCVVI